MFEFPRKDTRFNASLSRRFLFLSLRS